MGPSRDNGVDETVEARLRSALDSGDPAALDQIFALVYDELQILARRQRRRWSGDYTLNTTALVHEAYVKLAGHAPLHVETPSHFRALASRAMRHILCSHARDRRTQKRGGGREPVPLHEVQAAAEPAQGTADQADMLAALDESLARLERVDPRQSRVVECRFFGGLTIEETAAALDISPRTVKRDWAMAQAWIRRDMDS